MTDRLRPIALVTTIVLFSVAPVSAQTASMTMGSATPGQTSATMSMDAGGMSMSASTGGRSMSIGLGATGSSNPPPPGTPSPGNPGSGDPSRSDRLAVPSPFGLALAASDDAEADKRACLRTSRGIPDPTRRIREQRRCNRLR